MKSRGFSLVEVMVSLTILTVGVVTLLLALVQCIISNNTNVNQVVATLDAQSVLEEIKNLPFANISNSYTVQQPYNNLANETISINVTNPELKIKNVTVTVGWNEREASKSLPLFTKIAR